METMSQYFSYSKDYAELPVLFGNLYQKLRIMHDNGMCVPSITAEDIVYDSEFSFKSMVLADNLELRKRENIVDLTKLFLGAYVSLSTGFRDFSQVDSDWFFNNLDSINSIITAENFYPEYFRSVFVEGNNIYYDEFAEKKKNFDELNSRSNKMGYRKVLKNAGSSLYAYDSFDDEIPIERKSAFVNFIFYPTIIGCSLIVCFVIYTCLKYIIK